MTNCPFEYTVTQIVPAAPLPVVSLDKGVMWTGPLTVADLGTYTVTVEARQGCYTDSTSFTFEIIDCASDTLIVDPSLITEL